MLQVDVTGCPTVCMHCWAQGGHYPAMAMDDINWVLDNTEDFCKENNITLCAFPMNETIAHPEALQMLKKFRKYAELDGRYMMEPLPTTGVPIATRSDWAEILETSKQLGTTFLAFSFHGIEDVHDSIVNRKGAYKETCTAIERTHSLGLECHANVFLTKESIKQFDELLNALKSLNVERISWAPAFFQPTKRGENMKKCDRSCMIYYLLLKKLIRRKYLNLLKSSGKTCMNIPKKHW